MNTTLKVPVALSDSLKAAIMSKAEYLGQDMSNADWRNKKVVAELTLDRLTGDAATELSKLIKLHGYPNVEAAVVGHLRTHN